MTNIILATAGYDHTIKFWDPNQGACLRSIPFNDSVSCGDIHIASE